MKNKKMLYMMGMALGVIVLIIIIIVIIASVGSKGLAYDVIEEKMKSAAESYYQSREEELPTVNGTSVVISAEKLADNTNMKSLDKMQPKGSKCSGKVIVTKNGEHYLYSSILDCGSDYSSKKLNQVLTAPKNIVISGEGLYAKDGGYVFKGENVNNLIKIGDNLWAVLDVDSEGYMRLVNVNSKAKQRVVWDDRYNLTENSNDGINDYSVSRLKDTLLTLEKSENYLLEDDKKYVALKKWCIGKRSESNLEINNKEECQVLSNEQMFGLPYLSDAYIASIDKNCKNIDDASCDNYNFFSGYTIASWTLTGVSESTSAAYYVAASTYIPSKTATKKQITPTIYLSNNVMYASGEGTVENPYLLK